MDAIFAEGSLKEMRVMRPIEKGANLELGKFHLAIVEGSHGGISETSDFEGLFDSWLGSSLEPNPSPLVLLVLLAELLQGSEVVVTALRLAIKNVRKEGENAELLILATF